MYFNSKTILSALMILLCGICAEGEAKSKKKSSKHSSSHSKAKKNKKKGKSKKYYTYPLTETTPVTAEVKPKQQPVPPSSKQEEKIVQVQQPVSPSPKQEEKIVQVKTKEVKTEVTPEVVKDTFTEPEILKKKVATEPKAYIPEHADAPLEHLAEQQETSFQTEVNS